MMLQAPPPRRHISSAPVSLSSASALVHQYLENAEAHPHLHPDAIITSRGITFNSQDGATGAYIMHHLQRVAAGLRGEHMPPDVALDREDDEEPKSQGKEKTQQQPLKSCLKKPIEVVEEDWEDMATYQAEQGMEIGEVGPRTNFVREGGEEPDVVDKAARKKAKQEKRDREKKEREALKASAKKRKEKHADDGDIQEAAHKKAEEETVQQEESEVQTNSVVDDKMEKAARKKAKKEKENEQPNKTGTADGTMGKGSLIDDNMYKAARKKAKKEREQLEKKKRQREKKNKNKSD